jgi:hypothetical protein
MDTSTWLQGAAGRRFGRNSEQGRPLGASAISAGTTPVMFNPGEI